MAEKTNAFRRLINWDVALAILFIGGGGAVVLGSYDFPAGRSGVPGPAFFPRLVGVSMCLLGALLAVTSFGVEARYRSRGRRDPVARKILLLLGLIAVYLVSWEWIAFPWRTAPFLLLLYRLLGESWLRSGVLSVSLTTLLYFLFSGLFAVRL